MGAVQTLIVPLFFELKATCFPSGDRLTNSTPSPRSRSGSSRPVARVIDQSDKWLLLRSLKNAILSPSGNQLGIESVVGFDVSSVRFLPSASASQISALVPARHRLKAIL